MCRSTATFIHQKETYLPLDHRLLPLHDHCCSNSRHQALNLAALQIPPSSRSMLETASKCYGKRCMHEHILLYLPEFDPPGPSLIQTPLEQRTCSKHHAVGTIHYRDAQERPQNCQMAIGHLPTRLSSTRALPVRPQCTHRPFAKLPPQRPARLLPDAASMDTARLVSKSIDSSSAALSPVPALAHAVVLGSCEDGPAASPASGDAALTLPAAARRLDLLENAWHSSLCCGFLMCACSLFCTGASAVHPWDLLNRQNKTHY